LRIGHGYDAHRLVAGRPLKLGGVTIPSKKGLFGHSDADVLTHAVMDALLGAAALGDLGAHFPDTDDKWHDADSVELLGMVVEMLWKNGWRVENVDCTVVAEKPRLAPYVSRMRETLAVAMNLEEARVSVKATTTEGMGFTGQGRGIEAHAVVLLVRNPVD
jgi:2-C-methyl-D-erythritol 2,4-cyclodiphosphate synthase